MERSDMDFDFRNYPLTCSLIVINVVVFAVLEVLGMTQGYTLYNAGVLTTSSLLDGQYYTLITSMFLHGGLMHLLCNMITMYYIGTVIEDVFGPVRFLIIYFLSGIAGGLTSMAVMIAAGENGGVVGASGALFGLFGAYGYLLVREHRKPVVFMRPTSSSDLKGFFGFLVLNIIIGLTPGIAMEAHIGGMICGLLASIPMYELMRVAVQREIDAGHIPAPYIPKPNPGYDYDAATAAHDAAMAAQNDFNRRYDSARPHQKEEMREEALDLDKR